MNANNVLKALEEARQASFGERVEVEMVNPSSTVIESIEENGGRIESKHWVEWCHSDTCAHNSHDAGQEVVTALIPPAWIVQENSEAASANLFEDANDLYLRFVIPCDIPVGIFTRDNGRHFAVSTVARDAKVFQ